MRDRPVERLIALDCEFLNSRSMRACPDKKKVARSTVACVYRISGCLQCVKQVIAFGGPHCMLHLVDDKHHICVGLVNKLCECLGEADTAIFT